MVARPDPVAGKRHGSRFLRRCVCAPPGHLYVLCTRSAQFPVVLWRCHTVNLLRRGTQSNSAHRVVCFKDASRLCVVRIIAKEGICLLYDSHPRVPLYSVTTAVDAFLSLASPLRSSRLGGSDGIYCTTRGRRGPCADNPSVLTSARTIKVTVLWRFRICRSFSVSPWCFISRGCSFQTRFFAQRLRRRSPASRQQFGSYDLSKTRERDTERHGVFG